MKINTRSITLAATLAALCAVTGVLPYVFFLPVIVAASTLSVGMVAFVGLAFGCISLSYSFVMPSSLVSLAFINAPYLAIIPRILAALGCFGFYKLLMRIFKPQKSAAFFAVISASGAVGSLLNTGLVVGAFALILPELELGGVTMIAYIPAMLISGAIECACMAVLAPPIVLTLEKTVFRNSRTKAKKAANMLNASRLDAESASDIPDASDSSKTSDLSQNTDDETCAVKSAVVEQNVNA